MSALSIKLINMMHKDQTNQYLCSNFYQICSCLNACLCKDTYTYIHIDINEYIT